MQRDLKNAKLPTRGYTKLQPQLCPNTSGITSKITKQNPTQRSKVINIPLADYSGAAGTSSLHLSREARLRKQHQLQFQASASASASLPVRGGRRASLIQKEISHTSEIMSQSSHVSSAGLEMELVYSRLSLMTHEHVEQTRGSHQLGF